MFSGCGRNNQPYTIFVYNLLIIRYLHHAKANRSEALGSKTFPGFHSYARGIDAVVRKARHSPIFIKLLLLTKKRQILVHNLIDSNNKNNLYE